jgi:hypothetical protein
MPASLENEALLRSIADYRPGSEGTGGAESGGAKKPLAVIPIAATPDALLFRVVPLPMAMLPFEPLRSYFSMLIIERAVRPTVEPYPFVFAAEYTEREPVRSRETAVECDGRTLGLYGGAGALEDDVAAFPEAGHARWGAPAVALLCVLDKVLGPRGITSMASSMSSSSSIMLSRWYDCGDFRLGEGVPKKVL